MKRLIAAVVVLATIVVAAPASAVVLEQQRTQRMPCSFDWYRGPNAQPSSAAVYRMGDCFSRRFGVSPAATRCRLEAESHGYAYARNGRFYGPLQIGYDPSHPNSAEWGDYWGAVESWAQVKHPNPGPFNARASIIAGVYHAAHYGWDAWTTCR